MEVEEEVETVAEAPLALPEAAVAIEVEVSVGVEVAAAVEAVVAVVDLLSFESFGMYLVNPVLSSLC